MDNDDRPVGYVLNRRQALSLLGAASAAMIAACAPLQNSAPGQATQTAPTAVPATATMAATSAPTAAATVASTQAAAVNTALPSCVVVPELTEGPYFVDEMLNRSDVRSDPSDGSVQDGALLNLAFRVSQINSSGCAPLAGAQVDIWHCNALGVYSDASDPSFNTKGKKFLRGYQVTDANGMVQFTTIYPGWYPGRAVHIHFKIRTTSGHEFTSQLFFDDALTDQVQAHQPYAAKGQHTLRNDGDGIYQQGGKQLVLDVNKNGSGYTASFDVGMQIS